MQVQEEHNPAVMETQSDNAIGARGDQPRRRRAWLVGIVLIVAVVVIFTAGILPRVRARATLRRDTDAMAVPTVAVVEPGRASPAQEIVLPANVQAFRDAPIYARTNGYLKRWYADIGTHVKAGQLLAEIETPEVDQQLRQSRADLATAQANLKLSAITAERYAGLLKTDSVSKQEADNAAGDYAAKQAMVQSAQANVQRLQQMQSFEKIYAPFDGVISARNTDVGALIDSGSSGGGRGELFHIVQPNVLRAYINVPEAYSQAARPGMTAELTLTEFAGRRFPGKLVRTADAIDPNTRTLLTEVDVDNAQGTLKPGSYAEVHLKLPTGSNSHLLPVNTLLFRSEGLRVATVDENNRVVLKPITIGHDFGSSVEVVAGLEGTERVVINPPDSLAPGERVNISNSTAGSQ
jgi:RND family efflux transporter MFP subunit